MFDRELLNSKPVAVKTVQGDDCTPNDLSQFMEEVLRMRGFQHKNVLTMLGLVEKDKKPMVVLPFMQNGDLKSYLANQDVVILPNSYS